MGVSELQSELGAARAETVAGQLSQTHLHTQGDVVEPLRPSPVAETWREYLEKEILEERVFCSGSHTGLEHWVACAKGGRAEG